MALADVRADADDAVLVLPTGPTRTAQILELDRSGDSARVVETGRRVLVDGGPVPIRDLELLPDDSTLMTDVGERGVVMADADGGIFFSLNEPGGRLLISSASVSAYSGPGEVARILVTDSNRSQAFVLNPKKINSLLWIEGFSIPGSAASFVQGIAMPGQLAAIALNWKSVGVSAIDIFETSGGSPTGRLRRLASDVHPNQPEETVIIPELASLRDVLGLPNGNLLVTAKASLLEVTLEGEVRWRIELGQQDERGEGTLGEGGTRGEFVSAALLPSGNIALATHQAGQWTTPHDHHRVYWLSPGALEESRVEVIARSAALSAAPARLRAGEEVGGSGTFGFYPGLDSAGSGGAEDLELSDPFRLNAASFRPGDAMIATARLINSGDETVSLSRLSVVLNAGACGAQTDMSVTLEEMVAVDILAGETLSMRLIGTLDPRATPGRWCARLFAQLPGEAAVELGEAVGFDVRDPADRPPSTVELEDLDFWQSDGGPGGPDAGGPGTDYEVEVGTGCGCATSTGASGAGLPFGGLLMVIWGAWRLRRVYKS